MHFVSFAFLALLALSLILRVTVGRQGRETPYLLGLLLLSLIFYSWHVPWYFVLLLTSTVVDFFVGEKLHRIKETATRKQLLWTSLGINLGMLGTFKYYNFGVSFLSDLIGRPLPVADWVLPMGISFYTFQSMSYTIDIYRGQLTPVRSFWRFFLFVAFFPQLVAGPIVRAKEFLYQLDRKRRLHWSTFSEGTYLIIQGFFLKIVVADNLARGVDQLWPQIVGPEESWVAAVAVAIFFAAQIFADFCGYSRIARGIGYYLGFKIPKNFNSPYLAMTFSEFWQRWHMTLSRWLKDYLYISLGGNRDGVSRTYRNLLITMVLGGLWHGANYTFIAWGLLHGLFLVGERALGLRKLKKSGQRWAYFLVVQAMVLLAWVFFRSENMSEAIQFCERLMQFDLSLPGNLDQFFYPTLAVIPVVILHIRTLLTERFDWGDLNLKTKAVLSGFMTYFILTTYGVSSDFIYFQF